MASKPETIFTKGVNRHLPNTHAEKMNNPFRSGGADVWYSGNLGDLWVEYKFEERIPKNSTKILPAVTPRQQEWLLSRYAEGRNIAVVLGTPDGGVIYCGTEWMSPLTSEEFRERLISKADIARWIFHQVGAKVCPQSLVSSPPPPKSS